MTSVPKNQESTVPKYAQYSTVALLLYYHCSIQIQYLYVRVVGAVQQLKWRTSCCSILQYRYYCTSYELAPVEVTGTVLKLARTSSLCEVLCSKLQCRKYCTYCRVVAESSTLWNLELQAHNYILLYYRSGSLEDNQCPKATTSYCSRVGVVLYCSMIVARSVKRARQVDRERTLTHESSRVRWTQMFSLASSA